MKSFDGRVVAITGAGSGIGRALAVDLAGRGALLALRDVDPAGLTETVDLVKAAGVREVRSDVVDVVLADWLSRRGRPTSSASSAGSTCSSTTPASR